MAAVDEHDASLCLSGYLTFRWKYIVSVIGTLSQSDIGCDVGSECQLTDRHDNDGPIMTVC